MTSKAGGDAELDRPESIEFDAAEYHADSSFGRAHYRLEGSSGSGWRILRNGAEHLSLGPGYRLLRTVGCGVCSTDLDRHFLPFPLPQVTGHELVAQDEDGRRYVVEINASHQARAVDDACPFCSAGLPTHCPDRLVLGIHDLPGGFGPYVLAPLHAMIELPEGLPHETALLVEPFAAVLNAVTTVAPRPGDTIAVLGPRRLGLLAIAALAAERRRTGSDFDILAIARHEHLLALASRFGANRTLLSEGDGSALPDAVADVVIDTTASPDGLRLAVRLAAREVHLKSTHGQPAEGLAHTTELVVDEIALGRLPGDEAAGAEWLDRIARGAARAKVAWMAKSAPPSWLARRAACAIGDRAAVLLAAYEDEAAPGELPRADAVVVEDAGQVDAALRPSAGSETSLVRPRGEIVVPAGSRHPGSSLLSAIASRGLRLSSSRCGDFHAALELMRGDPELQGLGERLVTHRFPAASIVEAFEMARSPECIKAVIEHPPNRTG